jgi:hypothetical protein
MADVTLRNDSDAEPSRDVLVHCGEGVGGGRRFLRVPCIGEHIVPSDGAGVYRVYAVVHVAFRSSYGAEIWCTKADLAEIIQRPDDGSQR